MDTFTPSHFQRTVRSTNGTCLSPVSETDINVTDVRKLLFKGPHKPTVIHKDPETLYSAVSENITTAGGHGVGTQGDLKEDIGLAERT